MTAIVNQDTCIGCGVCISMCSDVYTYNDDSKAEVLCDTVPSDLESDAEEARDSCPVDAIDIKK